MKKIYLFGSYSRGEATKDSDLDICVVIDDNCDDNEIYLDIADKLFGNRLVPCDKLVYKEHIFYGEKNPENIENKIMKDGILLYG